MADDETMTLAEVAAHLGMKISGAYSWLERRGIEPVGRAKGRGGQSLYRREQVMLAPRNRRGYRSDLHDPPA